MKTAKFTDDKPNLPAVDVIVPTHNNLELTVRCLDALYRYTTAHFHLIVVDDSIDFTPQYLEWFKTQEGEGNWVNHPKDNMTIIHTNTPFKSGNQFFNVALKETKFNYVATVMNSVCVEPEWETVALPFMEKIPKVGVVGLKTLFYPTGVIEGAGIAFDGGQPFDIGKSLPGHRLTRIYEVDAVAWAFAILRRKAIKTLNETEYNGFLGWDDLDNCFEIKKDGWKIYYCGYGVGYHEPHATRGNNSEEATRKSKENGEFFRKKWGFTQA